MLQLPAIGGEPQSLAIERRARDRPDTVAGETLKTIIFDVLSEASLSDESASMKMLAQASIALRNLEQARRMSVQTRQKIMTDFVRKAGEAVEKVAEQRGLTAETVDAIKAQILGVRPESTEVA
jgi:hypothetical protein